MAAILDVLIPQQNFELIRNKVGLIIAEECANQFILGATQLEHLQVLLTDLFQYKLKNARL